MEDSILKSVKQVVGVEPEETDFDTDFLFAINTVFDDLNSLGVGPEEGFDIVDDTAVWSSYCDDGVTTKRVKTLMTLRVRLIFDPPATSFHIAAIEKMIDKLEFLVSINREYLVAGPI